jgi:hypothetical protein
MNSLGALKQLSNTGAIWPIGSGACGYLTIPHPYVSFPDLESIPYDGVYSSAGQLYIVGAKFNSDAPIDADNFIFKIDSISADPNKIILWYREVIINTLTYHDKRNYSICLDSAGNVYVGGQGFPRNATVNSLPVSSFIYKFSASGTLQWSRYRTQVAGVAQVNSIKIDNANNIYALSHDNNTKVNEVAKYYTNSDIQWTKYFAGGTQITSSRTERDRQSFKLLIDNTQNIIVLAEHNTNVGIFIGTIDPAGNNILQLALNRTIASRLIFPLDIVADTNNDKYILGFTQYSDTLTDVDYKFFITKINGTNIIWQKYIDIIIANSNNNAIANTKGSLKIIGYDIYISLVSDIIVGAVNTSYIIKINGLTGDIIWANKLTNVTATALVLHTADNRLSILGYSSLVQSVLIDMPLNGSIPGTGRYIFGEPIFYVGPPDNTRYTPTTITLSSCNLILSTPTIEFGSSANTTSFTTSINIPSGITWWQRNATDIDASPL